MAGFRIELFKGIRPRISARKLPVGEAQTAQNAKLGSGDLRAWDEKDAGTAVDETWYNKTIYLFDNAGTPRWFEWSSLVDVARGPVKDDSLERTYFTGDGIPKMTYTTIADAGGGGPYPEGNRDLGIPAPPNKLGKPTTTLPENVPADERVFSSITVDAFVIDNIQFFVYPGTGSDNQTWSRTTAGDGKGHGTLQFILSAGDGFRVKKVISATKALLEGADTPGVFARTDDSVNWGGSVSLPSPVPIVYLSEGGSTKEAVFDGWVIPEATVTFAGTHYLTEGDVIRVTSASEGAPTQIAFPVLSSITFYEQSFDVETLEPIAGTSGDTAYKLHSQRIAAAAVEGAASFALNGTVRYQIDRAASDEHVLQDRQYVYTYVSNLGEEGPPSPVSGTVKMLDGNTAILAGFENVFTHPDLDNRDIDFFRVYRTSSTEAGTEFQFVKELAVGTASLPTTKFVDTVPQSLLGEALDTATWFPPDADMEGIIALPNGVLAGFKGKTVFLTEPYFPHAWPPEYDQAVDYNIIGLANIGNSLIVLTEGYPYSSTGAHPRSMNLRPFKLNQSCQNKESIANEGDKVFYASPDGLVEISINGARIVTDPYAKKEEWASYSPSTMVGEFHDGKYFGFFDGPSNVTQPPAIATLTGTFVSAATDESDIQAGGKTIIITLTGTGSHTWEDAGAAFNATRQAIIDSFDSNKSEANGWDAERSNIPVTDVARTSSTVVTITLSALANFEITVAETLTCILPTSVFKATAPADSITAANTLTLGVEDDFSSKAVFITDTGFFGYSTGDADQWSVATIDGGAGTTQPLSLEQFDQHVVYDSTRERWIVSVRGVQPLVKPVLYMSDDDTGSWIMHEAMDAVRSATGTGLQYYHYYPEYDLHLGSFGASGTGVELVLSQDGGDNWVTTTMDAVNQWDKVFGESGFTFLDGEIYAPAWKDGSSLPKMVVAGAASPADHWSVVTPDLVTGSPTGHLHSVAAGNGKVLYCWVSGASEIEIGEYDPVADTSASIGTLITGSSNAAKIVWGNGIFMVMDDSGSMWKVTADGSESTFGNWSTVVAALPINIDVRGLYYDPGDGSTAGWGWVACGENTSSSKGVIYTSSDDGDTWTLRHTTSANAKIISMAFSNYLTDLERA